MNKIYPYAGFWKQTLAGIIDVLILSVPSGIVAMLVTGMQVFSLFSLNDNPASLLNLVSSWIIGPIIASVLNLVICWLYQAFMESSKLQATLGKMALGIKVVGKEGQRISFARATGRFFAQWISAIPFYFGFFMAGFTKKRQALHDMITSTYVVDKTFTPEQPLPELSFSKGGCAASIIIALAPLILILAGIAFFTKTVIPDLQDTWNDLDNDTEEIEYTNLPDNLQRSLYLSNAEVEITNLIRSHTILQEPFEKGGVTYSQSLEGYKASFRDSSGNEYEVLRRPGDFMNCCLKGPNGKCCDKEYLCKPCDQKD